ncbi:KR-domain-containing protein [Zopfia rhizophila CBS 207.26]|uniref:KR-domain-containing protein n=1 Tax=Zopfia rhizophila CBS 207.26 TaxID=1314779 RepID=A0A6A6DW43_9PEZI|nr:KR-domain-containing protein [Zopfia rhizophila CBS 207.26]
MCYCLILKQIFATVGFGTKANFLVNTFNDNFLTNLMRETKGKDLVEYGQLDMQPFLANRSYCCVEVAHFMRKIPEKVRQTENHIGKVIAWFPNDPSKIERIPSARPLQFNANASYLPVVVLGGLGRDPEDHEIIAEVETGGSSITLLAEEVQNEDDMARAVAAAKDPIKDASFLDMKYEEWQDVVIPKVDGTWNLHHAFKNAHLDFFVLTSSITSIIEAPGQSNYNSANTFLEAFCQYRHSISLPASVISICPVNDAGFIAENVATRKTIQAQGISLFSQKEFLDYLQLESHTSWRRDRWMDFYPNIRESTDDSTSNTSFQCLKFFLSRVTADPNILTDSSNVQFLAVEIGCKIFSLMLINISLSISDIGVDSLMAIELRRWWNLTFGLDIGMLEIMGQERLRNLGTCVDWDYGGARRLITCYQVDKRAVGRII